MIPAIESFSQVAAAALIASVWQGVLLAAALWAALKFSHGITAGVRFLVWTAVFLAICLLPVYAVLSSGHGADNFGSSFTAFHPAVPRIELDFRWAIGIAALWLGISAIRLWGLFKSGLRSRAIWKRSTPLESTTSVKSLFTQAGLRRALLCASPDVDQPCVIGFLAPRILVPEWLLEKATGAELEQIVLHELAHLRRFDNWTNLVQKLATALFPLNPALLWVERRLCAEREAACDECVVFATRSPSEYATCLTNLAEQRIVRKGMALSGALSLGAWERRSQLAGRIENILRGGTRLSPLKSRLVLAAFLLATAGGTFKLSGTGELVSFTTHGEDRPTALAASEIAAGAKYREAVFHAPSPIQKREPQSESMPAPLAAPAKQRYQRRPSKNTVPPAPAGGVQSFIVVTRWQDSSGRQLTVIDKFVRISALPAAQSQAGWLVVQL